MLVRFVLVAVLLAGCTSQEDQALGTLEWDTIHARAISSEAITEILVAEGDIVEEGALLLKLDDRKQRAAVAQVQGELQQAVWMEKELMAGPREEDIAEARARLVVTEADVVNAELIYGRRKSLLENGHISQELFDNAKNVYENAVARKAERAETLNKLLAGTRVEQLEQVKAKVQTLTAMLQSAQLLLDEYSVTASRAGRIDSLPYKLGDRPPKSAVVCTLLSGEQPWARIYVPEPWKSKLQMGSTYTIKVDGQEKNYSATLRSLSAKANFTPYFALTEKDRSYLSYVAELDLVDSAATQLGSGTPVQLILELQ